MPGILLTSRVIFPPHYTIYICIIGAGFIVGLYRFRRKRTVLPVVWLLGITCCSEVLSKILALTVHNNIAVYQVYHPIQFTLWAVFFHRNLQSKWKKTILPVWTILFLFAILNSLWIQGLHTFPGNFTKLEGVIILFWSFCLFFDFLDLPAKENVFRKSNFIICIAVMWFNLVSYLFFGLFNYYIANQELVRSIWKVHLFSNYTYYTLLLTAMFLNAEDQPAYE
jgi:hypothetical protein